MAVNKVILNGEPLIDLTEDTVTAADVAQGKTFHLPDGTQAVGTNKGGAEIEGGYVVTFMANGSVYAISAVLAGDSVSAPLENPTATGTSFSGWSLTENGDIITFPYTPTADTTLYAIMSTSQVIGFTGLSNVSGILTWTDDIADLQISTPYTTSTSGNYVTVTGALDNVFPYNQIQEVEDGQGNTFIRFPKVWIKWINNSAGNLDGIKIANNQVDDDYFVPDCFLNPDMSGDYVDYIDIGKYEGSGSVSRVYSRSGYAPLVSITRSNFRIACRIYGSSENFYNGYQQLDIQTYTLYNFLCMLYYRTANIQTVYEGRTSASNAAQTGSTDSISGLNGWNSSTDCVKMLGVENPYGNINKWCDGVYFSSSTIYIQRYPTQYADSTTNGTVMGFSRPTSAGFISALRQGSANATKSAVYCSAASGSSSTYVGDYENYSSSGIVLHVGGNWNYASSAGLWGLRGSNAASYAHTSIGGRLCKRPL